MTGFYCRTLLTWQKQPLTMRLCSGDMHQRTICTPNFLTDKQRTTTTTTTTAIRYPQTCITCQNLSTLTLSIPITHPSNPSYPPTSRIPPTCVSIVITYLVIEQSISAILHRTDVMQYLASPYLALRQGPLPESSDR